MLFLFSLIVKNFFIFFQIFSFSYLLTNFLPHFWNFSLNFPSQIETREPKVSHLKFMENYSLQKFFFLCVISVCVCVDFDA